MKTEAPSHAIRSSATYRSTALLIQEARLGIRPEDIRLAEQHDDAALITKVGPSEPLGAYTIVNAFAKVSMAKVRAPGQIALEPDSEARITLASRRVHQFAPGGQRLESTLKPEGDVQETVAAGDPQV